MLHGRYDCRWAARINVRKRVALGRVNVRKRRVCERGSIRAETVTVAKILLPAGGEIYRFDKRQRFFVSKKQKRDGGAVLYPPASPEDLVGKGSPSRLTHRTRTLTTGQRSHSALTEVSDRCCCLAGWVAVQLLLAPPPRLRLWQSRQPVACA